VAALVEEGMNLEQIQTARPIRSDAAVWNEDRAAEDAFVATIHYGVTGL
jgi:hypothetical protein